MEQDRYQQNHTLFIVGLISLLLCLSLLFFALYMLPHLLFGWRYDVPEFISYIREWISNTYGLTRQAASSIIFGFIFTWVMIFGLIAYYSSTRIDNQIYSTPTLNEPIGRKGFRISQGFKDSFRFFFFMLAILIIAFSATIGFHWMISLY